MELLDGYTPPGSESQAFQRQVAFGFRLDVLFCNQRMPSFEQHCQETAALLGQSYDQVHLWLDEFAGKPPHGMRHRKLRHHLAGIAEVRKLWGDQAAEAARQHIVSDLKTDGWTDSSDPFPRNEEHYRKMGLF